MLAKIGDWLVIENRTLGARRRRAHESLVLPGPDARVEPHAQPPEDAPG